MQSFSTVPWSRRANSLTSSTTLARMLSLVELTLKSLLRSSRKTGGLSWLTCWSNMMCISGTNSSSSAL